MPFCYASVLFTAEHIISENKHGNRKQDQQKRFRENQYPGHAYANAKYHQAAQSSHTIPPSRQAAVLKISRACMIHHMQPD
jgi:hypothetical protein